MVAAAIIARGLPSPPRRKRLTEKERAANRRAFLAKRRRLVRLQQAMDAVLDHDGETELQLLVKIYAPTF